MKKRILSLLTALILVFVILPVKASDTSEKIIAQGSCGVQLGWTLDEKGTLTIFGTGTMTDYSFENPAPWERFKNKILDVVIEEGVTTVGKEAFEKYYIKSVTFPSTLEEIKVSAFSECKWLENLAFSEGSAVTIAARAFCDCSAIKELDFSKGAFYIDVYAFQGCEKLEVLNLEDVRKIGGYAFKNCKELTKVTIPSRVKEIEYGAFCNCDKLAEVVIEDGITSIGDWAFRFSGITSIDIPESVVTIGDYAFSGTQIENITIPEFVTSIGVSAFDSCKLLKNIRIPASVKSIGTLAFKDCYLLENIDVSADNLCYSSENGVLFDKKKETLIWYPTGKGENSYSVPDGVKNIYDYAFVYCKSLKSIILPRSLVGIGNFAFEYCDSILEMIIPDSVTEIGHYAFNYCKALEKVVLPKKITSIRNGVFWGCKKLVDIKIPETITEIGAYAFWGCESLPYFSIPPKVDKIEEWTFGHCNSFSDIVVPDGVKTIDERAFFRCLNLKTIRISGSVEKIDQKAFEECNELTIYGFKNSVAEEVAVKNTIPFVSIEGSSGIEGEIFDDYVQNGFRDIDNYLWAAEYINHLAEKGIIKGTSETTYSPASNITRADFAILLVRAFEKTSDNTENFADVLDTDYFAKELAIARNTGLVGGIGDNKFAPRENIKRCDMMLMVYRVLESEKINLVGDGVLDVPKYSDFDDIPEYAKEAVSALIGAGLVNGKGTNIAPNDNTTRAEVAVLIKRVLDYIAEK